jgi:hypothetical protein
MEAVYPEEVFAELRALQDALSETTMRDPVEVPLLASVLARQYYPPKHRSLTRMQAETLRGSKCHCFKSAPCVCLQATWFMMRCWLKFASATEVWEIAQLLSREYTACVM